MLSSRLGIRGKLIVAFVGFTLVSAGAGGAWFHERTSDALASADRHGAETRLAGLVRLIRSELKHGAAQARLLASAVEAESGSQLDDGAALSALFVRFAREHDRYDQIRLLSVAGREIVRVNNRGRVELVANRDLQDKSDRYYFRQAIASGTPDPYVSRMDLNIEHGSVEYPPRVVLRFASKVGPHLKPAGVVILNVMVADLLETISPTLVGPGNELLVKPGRPPGGTEYTAPEVSTHLAGP